MNTPRRYAIAGLGHRAEMYVRALAADRAVLAAFCDRNRTRMNVHKGWIGEPDIQCYNDFVTMLAKEDIDVVIVCTPDHTHATYIEAALDAGCDVITEKPMTTDIDGCRRILDAQRRTGRKVTVAFNYRYNPVHRKVRELLAAGTVGQIGSVTFEWLLDTRHGADYFRRWHREKANSGGLLVHKSGHHFDLVDWWLDSVPETVYAMGRLFFYGKENRRRHGAPEDAFALEFSPRLTALYRDAEHEDGYRRDQNVFSDGITIEDDMTVIARYRDGQQLSYHLVAYSPREGYRVAFNGDKGRLELEVFEGSDARAKITVQPHWGAAGVVLDTPVGEGHGGGDQRMLAELLGEPADDPLGSAADQLAGMWSLATGLAANRSLETGVPVAVRDLLSPAIKGER